MNAEQLQAGLAPNTDKVTIEELSAGLESTLVGLDSLLKFHKDIEATGSVTRAQAEWLSKLDSDSITVSMESFTTVPSKIGIQNFKDSISAAWASAVAKRQDLLTKIVERADELSTYRDGICITSTLNDVITLREAANTVTDMINGMQVNVPSIKLDAGLSANYYSNNTRVQSGLAIADKLVSDNSQYDIVSLVGRFNEAMRNEELDLNAVSYNQDGCINKLYQVADEVFDIKTFSTDSEYFISELAAFLKTVPALYTAAVKRMRNIAVFNIDETSALFHINSSAYEELTDALGLLSSIDKFILYLTEVTKM